jgi:DEAD/DEAH box helicase
MVAPSQVRIYKAEEIDLDDLAAKAQAILQKKPFVWQLEIAEAVLRGEDVIVDVGTGSGKTLCFALPLLKDETDIVLVVSPLTALMVDQVRTFIQVKNKPLTYTQQAKEAQVATVAVCAETMALAGADNLYKVAFLHIGFQTALTLKAGNMNRKVSSDCCLTGDSHFGCLSNYHPFKGGI